MEYTKENFLNEQFAIRNTDKNTLFKALQLLDIKHTFLGTEKFYSYENNDWICGSKNSLPDICSTELCKILEGTTELTYQIF